MLLKIKISYNPKWLVNIFNDINRYKTKDKEYIFYFERIKDIFIKIKKGKKDEKYYFIHGEYYKMG